MSIYTFTVEGHPITSTEGLEAEQRCTYTISLACSLDGVGVTPRPVRFTAGYTSYWAADKRRKRPHKLRR